ncbi:hypothetical protein BJY04DRAFT_217958 [Aspergillus karnatakaensis]|uniref:uncharacterized protein n=1 Tax=Aspergillus karnatakaensis TaxID=1810916 RepID=UPI003CCCE4F1
MSSGQVYQKARAAWIAGVADNATYRKAQLFVLHNGLQRNAARLIEALSDDIGWGKELAIAACNVVLRALRSIHESLSLESDLHTERAISKGGSSEHRNLSVGVTLILGSTVNPLLSLLLPLVGSLAAGNSSILILPEKCNAVNRFVADLLRDTVDHEVVQLLPTQMISSLTGHRYDTVALGPRDSQLVLERFKQLSPTTHFLQPVSGQAVAIVDRSADLHSAATYLHHAVATSPAASLQGRPRVCFVNEFVLTSLAGRLVACWASKHVPLSDKPSALPSTESILISASGQTTVKKQLCHPVSAAGIIAALQTVDKTSLLLIPTTSNTHAIDLLNAIHENELAPVLYAFSASPEGSFFSRFARAQATFINTIPSSALVSWFPQTPNETISVPYSPSDFAVNHPVFQDQPLKASQGLSRAVLDSTRLKPPTRKPRLGFTFFEKGIFLGLGEFLVTVGVVVYGGTKVWRMVNGQL